MVFPTFIAVYCGIGVFYLLFESQVSRPRWLVLIGGPLLSAAAAVGAIIATAAMAPAYHAHAAVAAAIAIGGLELWGVARFGHLLAGSSLSWFVAETVVQLLAVAAACVAVVLRVRIRGAGR